MKRLEILVIAVLALASGLAGSPAARADSHDRLGTVLAAQPEETQGRYGARHPAQTLEFFGIQPGMTVVEALPGGGWYSKILIDYLGNDGHLVGADYAREMWPLFGFFSEEFIAGKATWVEDWTAEAESWRDQGDAAVSAFVLGSMPDEWAGRADAVLFIRALHNLARFESQGGYLSQALADAHAVLKPGGIFGVVQHQAPDTMDYDWAGGQRGYLNKQFVIDRVEAAGFEYLGETDVNANPADRPGAEDVVWRLPPTLVNSRDDPALRARMLSVGESNRMTVKFRKPG